MDEWKQFMLREQKLSQETGSGLHYYRDLALNRHLAQYLDRFQPGDQVVDVGCGAGYWTVYLAQRGVDVTGFDLEPAAVELTAASLAAQGAPTGRAVLADARSLPVAPGSLDGLISLGLLEHFPDHPELLAYWISLLKPGGRILLTAPNGLRTDYFWHIVLWQNLLGQRRWVRPRLTRRGWVSQNYGYEEWWWPGYFQALARGAGLDVTRFYTAFPGRPAEILWLLTGRISRMSAERIGRLVPAEPPRLTGLISVLEGRRV